MTMAVDWDAKPQHNVKYILLSIYQMMPRGMVHTRVRRRQSDAKWRASVAMCYGIMKNVIPNQKTMGRRKISKALTLKATENHILNLERALKELLEEKAQMCGKTIMIPTENNVLKVATFEDVQNDFADRQMYFFSSNACLGKKRYNVPTDIEASLDHLSLQACPLVTLVGCDSHPGAITSSVSPAELEQEKPHPDRGTLGALLSTPLSHGEELYSQRAQKATRARLKTPCKVPRRSETITRPRQGRVSTARVITLKQDITPAKRPFVKVDTYTTPSKACKQLPFSQSSGFTPIKLPLGLDDAPDSFGVVPSADTTPAKSFIGSTVGSPFSSFSLPKTPNSCFNGVEYLEDDNTSLLCNESIDTLDIEDIPRTPNQTVKAQIEGMDNSDNSTLKTVALGTPFRTPSVRDPEETETDESLVKNTLDRYGDDISLRKTKSSKCRRRLDRSYQQKDNSREAPNVDKLDSTSEFDGFLLFYNQNAHEIEKRDLSESKAVTMARMWKSLTPEDRAAYGRIAAHENSNNSNYLSDDLSGLELKPLSKTVHNDFQTDDLDPEDTTQEVPDLDLSASLFTQNSEEFTLVPEYADLGIIYGLGLEKEITIMPRDDSLPECTDDSQVVPDLGAA